MNNKFVDAARVRVPDRWVPTDDVRDRLGELTDEQLERSSRYRSVQLDGLRRQAASQPATDIRWLAVQARTTGKPARNSGERQFQPGLQMRREPSAQDLRLSRT